MYNNNNIRGERVRKLRMEEEEREGERGRRECIAVEREGVGGREAGVREGGRGTGGGGRFLIKGGRTAGCEARGGMDFLRGRAGVP